jgi:hypothetical protein
LPTYSFLISSLQKYNISFEKERFLLAIRGIGNYTFASACAEQQKVSAQPPAALCQGAGHGV